MLLPKNTKYRKQHKGRIHGNASRCNNMNYGAYGLSELSRFLNLAYSDAILTF